MSTIYIDVRHMDFWYGFYGFTRKTDWEDVIMFRKNNDKYEKIGWTCICSKSYLRNGLKDLEEDPDEKEFVDETKKFLDLDSIEYHYFYDKRKDEDFYEVPYEAERNSENIKPRSIDTWFPSEGIDKEVVDNCVKQFMLKFMNVNVTNVEFKEIISREDALKSYLEQVELFKNFQGISYSEELLQMLEKEWGATREKVLKILERSAK